MLRKINRNVCQKKIGKTKKLEYGIIPWKVHMESTDFYFAANEITDGKMKKNIFLSSCECKTFSILCNIIFPETLQEIMYNNFLEK